MTLPLHHCLIKGTAVLLLLSPDRVTNQSPLRVSKQLEIMFCSNLWGGDYFPQVTYTLFGERASNVFHLPFARHPRTRVAREQCRPPLVNTGKACKWNNFNRLQIHYSKKQKKKIQYLFLSMEPGDANFWISFHKCVISVALYVSTSIWSVCDLCG